jgi:chemotaxis protein histidine kinase CheA
MADWRGRGTKHATALNSYQQAVTGAGAALDSLRSQVMAVRGRAESALSNYPQEAAALRPIMVQIDEAQLKVDQTAGDVQATLDALSALDATAANTFNCIYAVEQHRPYPGVKKHRRGWNNVENHRRAFQEQAQSLFAQIGDAITELQRVVKPAFLDADVGAVVATIQAAEAAAAADAAAAAQAIEDARIAQQQAAAAAAQAEQDAIDARLEREEAARQAELAFEREQIEQQRYLSEQQRAWEREDRAARLAAEMRREQMAIDAEERRMRLQQEALLRQEERAIRREEREAQLEQLMLIQELAASGLPTDMLPAGLLPPKPAPAPPPAWSQGAGLVPWGQGGQFVPPGFATPPGAIPHQAWSPYGPMVAGPAGVAPTGFAPQVPGAAVLPTVPAYASPGYGGPPPATFQQAGVVAAGEAPPGFAWAGFDPGTEMFGMGDAGGLGVLKPTFNPNLQGGMIEEGWDIKGPDSNDAYTIRDPQGRSLGTYTEDQIFQGVIRDAGNNIIFVPPATRPVSQASAVTAEVAATLRELVKGVTNVMSAQEQRKAAKYGARAGAQPPALSTTPATGASSGMPSMVYVAAGLGLAGTIFFALTRKKDKKGKKGE